MKGCLLWVHPASGDNERHQQNITPVTCGGISLVPFRQPPWGDWPPDKGLWASSPHVPCPFPRFTATIFWQVSLLHCSSGAGGGGRARTLLLPVPRALRGVCEKD